MKRINAQHDNRDRIVFVRAFGMQRLYYQPIGSSRREWLFDTTGFCGSLDRFAVKYGARLSDGSRFITIGQLYAIAKFEHDSYNKVGKVLARIPGQVTYVIREYFSDACA